MRLHAPETQTLYAQLFEAAAAHELDLLGSFANGLVVERTVRGRVYVYWQLRDLAGRLRQWYLGSASDPQTGELRAALQTAKDRGPPVLDDLRRLTAAYLASGGVRHQQAHFRVMETLVRAGIFRAGAVLVGSHAFVSIGAALGVSWSTETASTADVDLCRDEFVSVACDETRPIDVPGVLKDVEPSFFLVPALDLKPSSSLMSRRAGVKLDLLTTARTPRESAPKPMPAFGMAAQPLRYMDYLVREEVRRGLVIGAYALVVNIPDAGRFALHKLAVATRRAAGESSIKADKDRRQAAALIAALDDLQPGALGLAAEAALSHKDRGLVRDMLASARRLPEAARDIVMALLGAKR